MKEMKITKPLIIINNLGTPIGLESMNDKAYHKSLENGVLWMLHGETERVLPFNEGASAGYLKELKDDSFGYTAFVDEGAVSTTSSEKNKESSVVKEIGDQEGVLSSLAGVIASRHREMPEGSYTTHLFKSGADKIRKKLGEEAVELILARDKGEVVYESADLFYHTLVLLEALDISLDEILSELKRRG